VSERSGIGFDSHRLEAGRALILGGIEIDSDRGLAGHSDADVLAHAIIDALLGAAGLGDIGQHFPDDDDAWRGADSMHLLSDVCTFLEDHGWTVRHVDCTLVCEAPKMAPYRDEIRRSLARRIGVKAIDVNVKFTTNEGMGFVGRGEGMAALAVATVERAD
jgi:2-C-methyl-D-erythritol 2,4-cyclodiphosphate synthase